MRADLSVARNAGGDWPGTGGDGPGGTGGGMSEPVREVLSAMPVGQRGRISGFDLPPEQHQRLLEMGLTVGTEFELVRFAPLGDPLELKVRGYNLSLRKRDAAGIRVSRL